MPGTIRLARALHLLILLYLSIAGWSRMALALETRSLLEQVGAAPGPVYFAAGGALWGILGLAGAFLLFVRRPAARWTLFGLESFIALTYWLDRLVFTRAAAALANWPFALLATIFLLLFGGSILTYLYRWEADHVRN
jgi:hypothetical protein